MAKVVLISCSSRLIDLFDKATRTNEWLFEFYDDHPAYEGIDLLLWDIATIPLSAGGAGKKSFLLSDSTPNKTSVYFGIENRYNGIQPPPVTESDVKRLLDLDQSEMTCQQFLYNHYEQFNDRHIKNYRKLPDGDRVLSKLKVMTAQRFEESIPQLKSFLTQSNYKNIRQTAHKIKSTCGNAGFLRLHILCHWLELAAEGENRKICVDLIKNCLDDTYSTSMDEWKSLGIK
jgi:HPt (histidine-containing phosphotransfer) domain-containing protein